jgi:hypothetical protein
MNDSERLVLGDSSRTGTGMVPASKGKVVRQVREHDPAAVETIQDQGGWIMPILYKMYVTQKYIWPLRGVARATPTFNFSGYRAQSWKGFWASLFSSLNAGANRAVKSTASAIVVAATITDADTTAVVNRSIGLIVRFTDSLNLADLRPITVQHFENGGVQQDYVVQPDQGLAEWIVLHVTNNRGNGVVEARADMNARILANGARAGAVLTAESINLREIEA